MEAPLTDTKNLQGQASTSTVDVSIREDRSDERIRNEWHPVILFLGQVLNLSMFALYAAITWEFIEAGQLGLEQVISRSLWMFVLFCMIQPVLLGVDFMTVLILKVWDEYRAPDYQQCRQIIYAITGVISLLLLLPYAWIVHRLLTWITPFTQAVASFMLPSMEINPIDHLQLMWGIAGVTSIGLLWLVAKFYQGNPFYPFNQARETLGLAKLIKGMVLMCYLRTLVPRKEFLVTGPIVNWVYYASILIVLHTIFAVPVFEWVIPGLLLMIFVPLLLSNLAPPAWLYLGASGSESAYTFYILRNRWKRHCLTLLDRSNAGMKDFYNTWHTLTHSQMKIPVPYNPTTPRVWSLRTRSDVWFRAVALLANYVPLIVIDLRKQSNIVDGELDWLVSHAQLNKTIIIENENTSPGTQVVRLQFKGKWVAQPVCYRDFFGDEFNSLNSLYQSSWEDAVNGTITTELSDTQAS